VEPLRPTAAQSRSRSSGDELDRIAGAVAAGNHDLRALGFWRVVGRSSATSWRSSVRRRGGADRHARVRTAVRTRVRPWIGVASLLVLFVVRGRGRRHGGDLDGPWAGLALVGAGVAWSIGWHLPAHAFAGWLAGIRFTDVFLGGPPPPRPG
jgi:hypothetical protein